MPSALTLENMSPGLVKVVERAQREPAGRCHALAHLLDVPALTRAYRRARAEAAVGVDGVTKEQYGQELEANCQALHARLKAKQYRHQPIRRVHIPKAQGKTRPIGIAAFEDKLVQDAVREVLEAIYEQDFLACSYGFRLGRSAHDAVRTLKRIVDRGEVQWILEADIVSFFDSLDRTELKKMLEVRVADGSLLRLIGTCLHVGGLDGETIVEPELGTAQGSGLSPLLGNVYLHDVLDLWFETEVKPRLQGKATLIRSCDDFIIGFEREDDARRVQAVLDKRMGRYGLTLHPDKTRLVPFRCPSQGQQRGQGPATFDFLGSRCIGGGPAQVTGGWGARHGEQASDGPRRPSTTGVDAIGISRLRPSTPRSVDVCEATSITAASAATFRVCCVSSRRRSGRGTSGCAVAANANVFTGRGLRISSDRCLSPAHGSRSGSGVGNHESH